MPPATDPARSETRRADAARFDFFFYGTLCDADVRAVVLGRSVEAQPAVLENYEAVPVAGGRYPMLQFQRGRAAAGVLCRGLDIVEAARLSYYEGESDYTARALPIRAGDGSAHRAWVFLPTAALRRGMGRWDLAEWRRFAKRAFLAHTMRTMRALKPKELTPFVDAWRSRLASNA